MELEVREFESSTQPLERMNQVVTVIKLLGTVMLPGTLCEIDQMAYPRDERQPTPSALLTIEQLAIEACDKALGITGRQQQTLPTF